MKKNLKLFKVISYTIYFITIACILIVGIFLLGLYRTFPEIKLEFCSIIIAYLGLISFFFIHAGESRIKERGKILTKKDLKIGSKIEIINRFKSEDDKDSFSIYFIEIEDGNFFLEEYEKQFDACGLYLLNKDLQWVKTGG